MPRFLRGLVRQCAAFVPARARHRPARLRTGGRVCRQRAHSRDTSGKLRTPEPGGLSLKTKRRLELRDSTDSWAGPHPSGLAPTGAVNMNHVNLARTHTIKYTDLPCAIRSNWKYSKACSTPLRKRWEPPCGAPRFLLTSKNGVTTPARSLPATAKWWPWETTCRYTWAPCLCRFALRWKSSLWTLVM